MVLVFTQLVEEFLHRYLKILSLAVRISYDPNT
jgi:hypothetical protein